MKISLIAALTVGVSLAAAPRSDASIERICRYRQIGLSLAQIASILDGEPSAASSILERRLDQLTDEIDALREQQRIIARLLSTPRKLRRARALDKARWVAILRATGLDDDAMRRWHREFERMEPKGHEDFLASLGIAPAEVARIRKWSREDARR